ncbi:MAG: ComEC/Rec2 family competence protein [Rhodoluna sp.]|nr:ComEC/Rec2 family competence protein [Rhodoluna sp.]
MTSPLIAITLWLQFLLGTPASLVVAIAALVASAIWFRKGLVLVAIALVLGQFDVASHTHNELRAIASEFQTRNVTLEVVQSGDKLSKVRLMNMPGCESCVGAVGQYAGSLKAGQSVRGALMIRPSFGFGEFVAKGQGVVSNTKATPVMAVRQSFLSSLRGISVDSKALVAGLAIGDTSLLSQRLNDQLKQLSLTHLNAVSGANCAIVVAAVFWLLGFVTRRRVVRVGIALLALVGYVLLVGGGSSVVRAAVMAAIVLVLLDRGVWPVAALSVTVSLMLLFDPNYATDYGFALSVFATGGILILAPALNERLGGRIPKPLALALSVTVAAQLWCMPVLLELQGGVPTYAVLANLLAEPVVAIITVLGISSAVLAVPMPMLASALAWLASIPAQWIVAVSKNLSQLPTVTLAWHTGVIGMLIGVVGLSLWFLGRMKRIAALAVVGVLAIEVIWSGTLAVRAASWLQGDWQIVNCNVGQGDGLVIRSQGQIAVVDVGREPKPIDDCLNSLGIHEINLLVLTHFDADHIAGLPGALDGRVVDQTLITPWPDDRPLVGLTRHLLQGVSPVTKAGVGTNGQLGAISWQVLSPSPTAVEATDSNDGSIVIRWESPDLVLYTMADLGEQGQMRMVQNFGGYLNHPASKPLVLKVSHHGSADQYTELIEAMHPDIAIISVGRGNSYGHPTARTLATLNRVGSLILRTDQVGAIGVYGDLRYAVEGGG